METRSKDPCPCGSGKRYKHCCKEGDQKKKNNYRYLFFLLPVVVVAIGLVLWSQRSDRPSFQQALTGQSATSGTASQDQSPLPDGRAPVAWEFDGERNRYWDPNHDHWHDGTPPPEGQRTVGAPANAPSAVNPNVPNPEPWQFDPESNQHFDPGHNHWHQGPAPPEDQRNASPSTVTTTTTTTTTTPGDNPDIPNPTPYQYDPVTNQYYDPGHAHWHRGTPPADQAEGGAATQASPEGGEEPGSNQ